MKVDPAKIRVPMLPVSQTRSYDCGRAMVEGMLALWHVPKRKLETALKSLETHPRKGTHPDAIESVCSRLPGLKVKAQVETNIEEVLSNIERRRPVGLLIRGHGCGHYVTGVGFDRKYLFTVDPMLKGKYGYLRLADFADRWWDREADGLWKRWSICIWKRSPPWYRQAEEVPV